MHISTIAKNIPASPIRFLEPYAQEARARGIKIYHLNIGDPDIETPEPMIAALKNWKLNPISYAPSRGYEPLLMSFLRYYRNLGLNSITTENLHITIGGSEGLLWTFLSVCNQGDEVITFEPFYTNYSAYAIMAHAKIVPILTRIENGFHMPRREKIEQKITKRTRAILLCNPSNPTGTVYTREEVEMVVDIAKKNGLFVISDEVYREFVYNGTAVTSAISHFSHYPEGIIVVDSLSKRYSLCGARVGVLVTKNQEIMQSFVRYGQARLSAGLIDQVIASHLPELNDSYYKEIVDRYKKRRDLLVSELKKIPGVVVPTPEGAFYIIVKLPITDASEFAQWLLTDFSDKGQTVQVAPATGCYTTPGLGQDEVRIAYVLGEEALKRSVEILNKALLQFSKHEN